LFLVVATPLITTFSAAKCSNVIPLYLKFFIAILAYSYFTIACFAFISAFTAAIYPPVVIGIKRYAAFRAFLAMPRVCFIPFSLTLFAAVLPFGQYADFFVTHSALLYICLFYAFVLFPARSATKLSFIMR
jgi:hypothetical protein